MVTKDYYKILDISPTATPDAIKQAYRKLAFKYHPDKTFGDPLAEHKFKDVVEAYETLSDKHKKINYDYDYKKQTANPTQTFTVPRPEPVSTQAAPHLSPHSILKTFIEVRKSVESIDARGKKIKQQALYNRLYELLGKNNIAILHAHNNTKINQQIVNNVLKCCHFLAYQYVDDLSVRLARVAATDNETIKKIYQFNRQKKRWSFWERHREGLTIAGVLVLFLCVLLILISL